MSCGVTTKFTSPPLKLSVLVIHVKVLSCPVVGISVLSAQQLTQTALVDPLASWSARTFKRSGY